MIVAIAAILLCFAANADALTNTKLSPDYGDCYTVLPLYDASANCANILIDPNDVCSEIGLGDALRGVPSGSVILADEIEERCPGAPNFFCCAQLVPTSISNPAICNQPTLTIGTETGKFRVAFIKCKQIQGLF